MSFLSTLFGIAPAKPHTGNVVGGAEIRAMLPGAVCGKTIYAQVDPNYIVGLLRRAQDMLASNVGGIRGWAPDATCTLFALAAVDLAQQEYYAAAFHDPHPAPALAAGFTWFNPDAGGGHAVNVFITASGPVFADPQSAQLRPLTPTELGSRYLTVFP